MDSATPRAAAACTHTSPIRGSWRSRPTSFATRSSASAASRSSSRSLSRRLPSRATGCARAFTSTDGRVGFYREGTHTLCEPQVTGQLTGRRAGRRSTPLSTALHHDGYNVLSVELTENVAASRARARHRLLMAVEAGSRGALERVVGAGRVARLHGPQSGEEIGDAGDPMCRIRLNDLTRGRVAGGDLRRHPESFFQANRFSCRTSWPP